MKKVTVELTVIAMSCFVITGCATKENVVKQVKNEDIRTVVEYKNDVKSKVVPPKALRATIYPYTTENGSYVDKHEMFYWVSLPKFSGKKVVKEKQLDSKIQQFIKE